ncbi:hypothetical protein ABB37_00204 [Leptomonas pyrrhocoris]|uniref:Uncharacterized protein n=1 Tax=Leptomonas pyrrhocoris TaxID=157538 RepID=A0A0N0E005_LEPPY|nr:hypothetical protein ABB37_00204 [Leptomonas pyrrhocoris]XP_015664324.1 hypothetical protein ABB37_00204 [Leptomonas pyrrhocoris]KPA85884.1 hypothetical protein ABB37_00204 [Leptomonas pyrrhocoris]KPA85885.1 hypothetical protein ABB37_00204 [Leptomonas pyrrhocoris]|eukprot:XP_015664323.1 hypothetical protein ABB37_00204 [Leptomonas pyrrhocoris]
MQRKFNSTNAQALAVYQALQQNGSLGAALDDDSPTGLYLSSNAPANGDLSFPPALLERLTKGLDKGGMGSMVLDPFCSYDYADRRHIRNFSMSIPIPFSAFDGIRRSKHQVQLTAAQEENVLKSFDKLLSSDDGKKAGGGSSGALAAKGAREISVALPFVSAFFDQRCPELRNGVLTSSREGATYLLLSVITGHKELCAKCLKTGANPNNMSFLRDEVPAPGDMFHGYSPVFMAVLAEQLEILDLLSSCGGSVHVYDRWGRTPLHAAMAMESVETVQWLLGKGAPLYIPDGFGILPADNCVGNQFADYSMPMLALQAPPTCPPLSYFAETSKSWISPDQEAGKETDKAGRGSGATEKTITASSPAAAATTTTISSAKADAAKFELCHCHSGRPAGYCGCVDDMLVRWSRDRLDTEWSPGVDFSALAKKQAVTEEERKRAAFNTGSRGKS